MINLNELSIGTTEKLRNALKIIIDGYELQPAGTERFFISVDKFSRIGLNHTETTDLFNKIEKEENGALSYLGIENITKYGKTNTAWDAMADCYKTEHPLLMKKPARLKQLYQEITKKLEPKKLPAEEVSTMLKFHNDNLAKTAKKISSIYSNSGISKAIEQLEQIITPYKITLETLNKTKLPLLRENSKLVNSALLEAQTSFKQFEENTKNIFFKTPIFDIDYFKTRPLPTLSIKPREAIQYIPRNTQEIREAQLAFDIHAIKEILQNQTKNNTNAESKKINQQSKIQRNLITKNGDGNFYYKDKIIKFKNKETIYYLIFECLFENGDYDGFCSYETIDDYFIGHKQQKYTDELKIKNRIKNGITSLFRFTELPQITPDGKKLISKRTGKGLILHNPKY